VVYRDVYGCILSTRPIVGTTVFTKYGIRSFVPQLSAPCADGCENVTSVRVVTEILGMRSNSNDPEKIAARVKRLLRR
jgi:hypothetical protein